MKNVLIPHHKTVIAEKISQETYGLMSSLPKEWSKRASFSPLMDGLRVWISCRLIHSNAVERSSYCYCECVNDAGVSLISQQNTFVIGLVPQ
ncbi:hypothetical protein QQP08_024993 [Theobroma cacao]|nr:hypothetical protein QQP08_024993 [Theobroma cacao]